MRQIWRVARRELRGYYDHPTAYILLVAFLLTALYIAFRTLYSSGAASLRPVFSLLPWLDAIFIPAMTMRAFAEERRSGTLEWLAAQPLTELDLVLGKYLGNLLLVLTTLIGTLPTAIVMLLISSADPGSVVAQYAGATLLAVQMTAIGVFASSIARSQVTAFIVGLGLCWGLVAMGDPLFLTSLPERLTVIVGGIGVLPHFESVARGVIDLRDALYFASTAAGFLALAHFAITRLRLSRSRGAYRRLGLTAAAVVAGVVLINLLDTRLRSRLDLTSGKLFTLSPASEEVLARLPDGVTVKLYASRALPAEVRRSVRDVRDLLADFRAAAHGKLETIELEPDQSADVERDALGAGLGPLRFSALSGNEFRVSRGWFGIAVSRGNVKRAIPIVGRTDRLEYELIAAISALDAPRRSRIGFLIGHDARTQFSYNTWREMLETRYALVNVTADSTARAPALSRDSIDVLVVAGPRSRLDSSLVTRLGDFVEGGGPTLFLLDGTDVGFTQVAQTVETGLEPLLVRRGIKLLPGLVFDLKANERINESGRDGVPYVQPYPLWPHTRPAARHPITAGLSIVTLAWATALEIGDTTKAQPLLVTSDAAGRFNAAGSPVAPGQPIRRDSIPLAPQVLAVAFDARHAQGSVPAASGRPGQPGGERFVVVGDADFLEDRFVQANPQNLAFATNALDWLLEDERLIRIRSKDPSPPPLLFATDLGRDLFKWGSLFGVPVLVAIAGAVHLLNRRRQATRRWEPRP